MVVTQVTEWSLPIPKVRGSNPGIGKILQRTRFTTNCWKYKYKEKEVDKGPFYLDKNNFHRDVNFNKYYESEANSKVFLLKVMESSEVIKYSKVIKKCVLIIVLVILASVLVLKAHFNHLNLKDFLSFLLFR